jgi:hypothetical protein
MVLNKIQDVAINTSYSSKFAREKSISDFMSKRQFLFFNWDSILENISYAHWILQQESGVRSTTVLLSWFQFKFCTSLICNLLYLPI